MSQSMRALSAAQQLETVRERLDEIRATANGPLVIGCNAPAANLVDQALRDANIPRKEFVLNADANRSQVYSALNGAGPIQLGWLWAQSPEFWAAYWPLVAKAKLDVSAVRKTAMRQLIDAAQILALVGPDEGAGE